MAATALESKAWARSALRFGRVEIEGRRRLVDPSALLVSHRRPQSAGFRSATAGIEHGNRRIVGMERGITGAHMTARSAQPGAPRAPPYDRPSPP